MSRETLMAVSARLFAKGGFDATSMRDIARDAGMLAGSMYYHFPSKNDLIAAVYEEGVAEISAAVDAAVAAAPAADSWARLEAACVAHLQSLLSDSAHAAVMTADLSRLDPRLRRRLVTLRDGYERRFVELVAALPLPAAVDRTLWRLQLLGALNWTPTWYRPGRKSPAAIGRAVVESLK
ncbi:MAG: TetR family transcriptional regulator [Reyranella sp.]|jgi:AcrR family transcriptional regulator|uniref:TetR/AcrR family transcriptional regulator n=1 Tax=Reyranella sp. TaxID=1929291 RepID=UPI0025DAAFD9|nr:TetR/AcrR family transcriptional regulator [Reyranella sp.]MBR2816628.1 TetR family transcriptional regulator [Reyranella sp.]